MQSLNNNPPNINPIINELAQNYEQLSSMEDKAVFAVNLLERIQNARETVRLGFTEDLELDMVCLDSLESKVKRFTPRVPEKVETCTVSDELGDEDNLSRLPPEALSHVVKFLDRQSVGRLSQVNQTIHQNMDTPLTWSELVNHNYPAKVPCGNNKLTLDHQGWKGLYEKASRNRTSQFWLKTYSLGLKSVTVLTDVKRDTIADIKEIVAENLGVHSGRLTIIIKGEAADDNRLFSYYKPEQLGAVHLVIRKDESRP